MVLKIEPELPASNNTWKQ